MFQAYIVVICYITIKTNRVSYFYFLSGWKLQFFTGKLTGMQCHYLLNFKKRTLPPFEKLYPVLEIVPFPSPLQRDNPFSSVESPAQRIYSLTVVSHHQICNSRLFYFLSLNDKNNNS